MRSPDAGRLAEADECCKAARWARHSKSAPKQRHQRESNLPGQPQLRRRRGKSGPIGGAALADPHTASASSASISNRNAHAPMVRRNNRAGGTASASAPPRTPTRTPAASAALPWPPQQAPRHGAPAAASAPCRGQNRCKGAEEIQQTRPNRRRHRASPGQKLGPRLAASAWPRHCGKRFYKKLALPSRRCPGCSPLSLPSMSAPEWWR